MKKIFNLNGIRQITALDFENSYRPFLVSLHTTSYSGKLISGDDFELSPEECGFLSGKLQEVIMQWINESQNTELTSGDNQTIIFGKAIKLNLSRPEDAMTLRLYALFELFNNAQQNKQAVNVWDISDVNDNEKGVLRLLEKNPVQQSIEELPGSIVHRLCARGFLVISNDGIKLTPKARRLVALI
jgi:hypothetical protein